MQNVGTAYAVKRAVIDGEPLTERVVTLTGEAVPRPGNVWARLGTPVRHLLEHAGFCPSAEQMVIMGGPLMGFTLPWLDVPVVKITNCLLAPSASEMGEPEEEKGCIRCSACADACPADLLPQQLYWFSKGQQHDKATAIIWPTASSAAPAPGSAQAIFRWCSISVRKRPRLRLRQEEKRAAEAKARFEARQARLERDKAARQERQTAAVQPAAKIRMRLTPPWPGFAKTARCRAADRVPAPNRITAKRLPPAKRAEARARKLSSRPKKSPGRRAAVDPRKAAVEAAIARAKARKAEQQAARGSREQPPPSTRGRRRSRHRPRQSA
jgi:electron transport complex protein RnfC